jgi:malonate decarboxylase beta subunit
MTPPPFACETLRAAQTRLVARRERNGACRDATELWAGDGIDEPDQVPDLTEDAFVALLSERSAQHDRR